MQNLNWGDRPDLSIDWIRIGTTDVLGFTPATPGCSRKVDIAVDPTRPVTRLRLKARGTVSNRPRRDRDVLRFRP